MWLIKPSLQIKMYYISDIFMHIIWLFEGYSKNQINHYKCFIEKYYFLYSLQSSLGCLL